MNLATPLGALAILALTASGAAAQTPTPTPNGLKGAGVFPLTVETSLVIRGVPGQIVVMTKPAKELRFTSRAKDRSGSERPLAVSFSGPMVTLAPPAGGTLPDGVLRVEAPASFAVRVEAQGGTVLVDGFGGAVAMVGKTTAARAHSLKGSFEADLEGGSLTLTDMGGTVTARIRAACVLTATNLRGALDLTSQDATFKVQGVGGACHLEAHGGSGELSGLAAGGTLSLSESSLRMTGGKGDMTVTSNAAVTFANMTGAMRFEMDGGNLHGQGNQGPVAVRSRRTEIKLEGISGDLDLDATRGNVVVQRVSGLLNAVIFAGDAKLLELQGPLRLDMDGGAASISWNAIEGDRDSLVENKGGDISVRFPGNASCRVSAKTRSGKITSDLPTIKAEDNSTEVSGTLGQGQKPLITIEADGNIMLSGGKGPALPS
jgi:hypothetical protein